MTLDNRGPGCQSQGPEPAGYRLRAFDASKAFFWRTELRARFVRLLEQPAQRRGNRRGEGRQVIAAFEEQHDRPVASKTGESRSHPAEVAGLESQRRQRI